MQNTQTHINSKRNVIVNNKQTNATHTHTHTHTQISTKQQANTNKSMDIKIKKRYKQKTGAKQSTMRSYTGAKQPNQQTNMCKNHTNKFQQNKK